MANAQISPYEKDNGITASYQEPIEYYQLADKIFDQAQIRKHNKRIILINNGIHPGEPEGIDASMILVRDLLEKNSIPRNVVICIIPIYNVDGMLNKGQSRVNQNGPESYGFRGNYQNLDLNRDFIKGDSGITGFLETPRYSTGYAALHNTIGFMPETHMLKPYPLRVEGTYKFMEHVIEILQRDADLIAKYKTSEVSGIQRLYYDRNEPYEEDIRIFDHCLPSDLIKKPFAYIIPQSWQKVIDLMLLNNVQMQRLASDLEIDSEMK